VGPVGKRRRLVVILAGILLAAFIAVLLALYPFQRARQDRADDRFRQMSIEVRRDYTRFWPAGAETVNRSVVAASCSRAFSDVKAQELTTCPNLADLDLSQCDLIDPKPLARLSVLQRLRSLSLAETPVDDGVLSVLATWPALDVLNLDRTGITASGLRHLLGQRRVKKLSVSGTRLSQAEVKDLRDAFPDVDVRWEPAG
jgi:hypothetical protein